jgi:hypothetical protein
MFSTLIKSIKEPKIRMGATQRNLQAQPKILKKLSEHQIHQSKRIFSQKMYIYQQNLQAQLKIPKK